MKDLKEILKTTTNTLNNKLAELEKLEKEKQDILFRFEVANKTQYIFIQKEIIESEKKFNNLLTEVKLLNKKIKNLKK